MTQGDVTRPCPDCEGKGEILVGSNPYDLRTVECRFCGGTGKLDRELSKVAAYLEGIPDAIPEIAKAISNLDRQDFAGAIMLMKHRAGQLGFFKTMHALEPATQAIGWEYAEHLTAMKKSRK